MSESTSTGGRTRLFLQVSAIALAAVGISERKAEAAPGIADGGLTIDVQGQYVFNDTGSFNAPYPNPAGSTGRFGSAGTLTPGDGYAIMGTVTYQRPGSPWSFAVGVRYGRMKGAAGGAHQQTASNGYYSKYYKSFNQTVHARLSDTTHYAIDFMVGHDVGVGMFGRGVTTVGGGIRYAHFDATVTGSFSTHSRYYYSGPGEFRTISSFDRAGKIAVKHNTDGVGPRVFVKTDSPFAGDSGFGIGAGAGVGVLFGRQTVHSGIHLSSGTYAGNLNFSRSRTQTIPTVDGYLQINWSPPKSKLSVGLGYRVDAYFTVMDAGFYAPHEINSIEHGPYLDLSIRIP